jgi:peptidoglycan glycosyltransferase
MACLLLFGLLILNVNWVQVVKADDYRDDPRNSRVLLRTYERERGPIAVLDADGKRQAVAESVRTDGPLEWLRTYPGGPQYASVTGYYSLVYGRTGIERAQDEELSGDADEFFVRRVSDFVTGRSPQGGAVLLTLDPAAQAAAYEGLQGNRGAVVALDPRTGAVLAMVSLPTFDPGRLSSFEPQDIRSYYAELNEAPADPLLNRAISKTYPPGSTFKVVTAAAALDNGVTTETEIPSPTVLDLPQTTAGLRNFGGASCTGETSTLPDAMRISCNTAFGALGLQLGDDELFDVRVTPLQMAMVAAGIANDGEVMRPYLVREVQAPDLSVVRSANPETLERAVSEEIADQLTSMMELVVTDGSGRRAQLDGVRVAGKTGTAQHAEGRPPHAWFISFAPADDPQVAVAVVIEDGGSLGSEATGGALAAPIAADVMRAVLGP